MLDNPKPLDKFLQSYRFKLVRPFLIGDVLDFGGNREELKPYVRGKYLAVNYDHSAMEDARFDTIVCLAVIEHIDQQEVYKIFLKFKKILKSDGWIFLTTPTKMAKPILEFLAFLRLINKDSIVEHKHYWSKKELVDLAEKSGLVIKKHKKFQLGFNQLAVFCHS